MRDIQLKDIRKTYPGGPQVLHGVSMEIHAGEFIVIVGPSGCGKSTLLRLIAGLEKCNEGSILIGGDCVNEVAPQDRDIAMIFQNYALYPHMNVRQNIAFGLELRGMARAERNARAEQVARMLKLDPYLDRKPGALSGGQRQRVAMGRAMARNSSIFLMDEPLSNLDNALRIAMRSEIKELHTHLGATVVYVTHDQGEALSLADRIAVMKDGHLLQFDTPAAIYDRPANRFVAGFLGMLPMNFLPVEALPGAQDRSRLTVGMRPEHMQVHPSPPDGSAFAARIAFSEMTGANLVLHCESDIGRLIVSVPRHTVPNTQEAVWIGYDMNHAIYFDSESGKRVELL